MNLSEEVNYLVNLDPFLRNFTQSLVSRKVGIFRQFNVALNMQRGPASGDVELAISLTGDLHSRQLCDARRQKRHELVRRIHDSGYFWVSNR